MAAAGPCTDCKPDAVASEKPDPLPKRYITAGIKGTDMGIGLFASIDANGVVGPTFGRKQRRVVASKFFHR